MTKKILIFSLAYYPNNVGGAEVAIKEITDRIKDIEFYMITLRFSPSSPPQEKIGNIFVHRAGLGGAYLSKILFIPLATIKGLILHRKHNFHAFWAMMTYMLLPIVFIKFFGARVPHVLTLQEGDTYEHVFKRFFIVPILPLIDYGFRTAKVVQVISNFLGDWAKKRGFKGPPCVIPNGASVETKTYSAEELVEYKKKSGKKEGDIYIVSVSRLVHKNAVDDIIRALPLLPENIHLLAVGGGPDEDMLRKLAKDLGVEKRVKFTGQVDRTETAKYRMISDIFARPSRSEGMGNSFASAMASRLPIIATQEGGLSDFIFDAKRNPNKETTAWVVDKDSPKQIAEAVKNILANPAQVKKVTDTCYKLVTEKYNWDSIAKDMRDKVFGRVPK